MWSIAITKSWRSPSVPCWVSAPPDEDPAGAWTSLCGGGPDFPRAKPLSPRHHPRSDFNPGGREALVVSTRSWQGSDSNGNAFSLDGLDDRLRAERALLELAASGHEGRN